jgi:hypothetical protein
MLRIEEPQLKDEATLASWMVPLSMNEELVVADGASTLYTARKPVTLPIMEIN